MASKKGSGRRRAPAKTALVEAPRPVPKPETSAPKAATTRKDRSIWFYQRATFPLRDAPLTELEKAVELNKGEENPELQWEEVGPRNIAGRVTSLVIHPEKWNVLYAGSAGGGVWRSENAGDTWKSCWPRSANHNIGAMAVHPKFPSSVIVATGEANLSPDSYPGDGFYLSMDSGQSWRSLFMTPDGAPLPEDARAMIPRRVGTIAFDPFSPDGVGAALGSVTHDDRMQAGLYLIDAKQGLVPCGFWGPRNYNCYSVLFHPTIEGLMFAAIGPRGAQNGIWRSSDKGKKWEQLKVGLPAGERFRRTTLAIAPAAPEIMYALAADREKALLGIYRSSNHGDTWEQIGTPEQFSAERFMSYNNAIVVHPERSDFVIWGGANLYRTMDAGDHWRQITFRFPAKKPRYVHEDHHALVMPRGDVIYSANDAGVAVSHDGGDRWENKSHGMVTTMFYDIDVAPTNSEMIGGGAQDNGTLIGGVSDQAGEFVRAFSGDGGWLVFDPNDEQHVFGSAQKVSVFRHRRGEPWVGWRQKSPSARRLGEDERTQRDIAILAIGPGTKKRVRVWAGTYRLWLTEDDGEHWHPASDTFDGSAISAIEIATADPQVMFVGTTNGGIFRSTDGGDTWSDDLASIDIPRRLITRVETHPKTAQTVVVTVASTGLPGAVLREAHSDRGLLQSANGEKASFVKAYSNVFQSHDLGTTWSDIDNGALPHVVYNAAVFESREPYRLFVGGDAGVFVKGPTFWFMVTGCLPNVVVSDLVYHERDQLLFAATYGRGIWRLRTDALNVGRT